MTCGRGAFRRALLGLLGATVRSTAVVLLAAVLLLPGAAPPAAHAQNVDPAVYEALAAAADGQATFVVLMEERADLAAARRIDDWDARGRAVVEHLQAAAARSQRGVVSRLNARTLSGRVTAHRSFWIANAVLVTGDRGAVDALAVLPGVAAILPEMRLDAPEQPDEVADAPTAGADAAGAPAAPLQVEPAAVPYGIDIINAEDVWTTYGVTGEGVVAGLVDTGVQWDHPALKAHYRGWDGATADHNYNWWDPANYCGAAGSPPCDWHGHGTHTTGTTAGGADGEAIGVAPGAEWIHAAGCCASNASLLSSLQWMLAPTDLAGNDPDPARRPHVVNNSWGGPGGSRIFYEAIEALAAAGIVPVFSAGNNGGACGTLGSPGDNLVAFNVGATSSSDAIASWSSRGSNPFDGQADPDVTAPGVSVRSSYPTDRYVNMSGTSMAAPHVTGAVALILSAEPDLVGKVGQVEELLRRTAVPLTTTTQTCGGVPGTEVPNNTYGWGRIDVKAAVDLVWQAGTLRGTVTDAETGLPVAGATVAISRLGKTLSQQTAADGSYSFVAGSGDYDMAVSAFGYSPAAAAGVSVAQDAVTDQDFELAARFTGSLTGVIQDSGGVPVAGATVSLAAAAPPLAAVTGPDGAYALAGAPYGSHVLDVTAAGYAPGQAAVELDGPAIAVPAIELVPAADYVVADGGDTCSVEYAWIDATAGTAHNLADDAYASVALSGGFPSFTFYGASYSTLYISSNGFVSFGSGYSRWHGIVPFEGAPNNQVIGLGEDLNPEGGSQGVIYTQDLGDGRFVIEYHAVEHWPSGDPETFEIILDRSDGSIVVQYQAVSWPDFANAGIENADGSRGILYSSPDDPRLADGLVVKYTPFSGAAPACIPAAAPDIAIARDGEGVVLSWPHLPPNTSYQVWRGTSPYFVPPDKGALVETLTATGEGMVYPAAGGIGDPEENLFYVVLGGLAGGVSGPSDRVGEFDFRLAPGG